jgi:rare lipoprotein A
MHRIKTKLNAAAIIAMAFAIAACSRADGSRADAPRPNVEKGVASWYGHPYHGRKTASGEIYDMEQLTAAHRVLPFGAVVRVTNLSSGQTVDVRINDRGPFVKDRIIDLSHAAATNLKIPGVADVSLELLSMPRTRGENNFAVQVGIYSTRQEADSIQEMMAAKYGIAKVVLKDGDPQMWRVIVGLESTPELAMSLGEKLRAEMNIDYFVVAADNE